MRQGKLSELIHNSDRYPNLQQCSVEIHFREIIDLVCPHFLLFAPPHLPPLPAWSRRFRAGPRFEARSHQDCIQVEQERLQRQRTHEFLQGRSSVTQRQGHRPGPQSFPHFAGEPDPIRVFVESSPIFPQGEVEAIALMKPKAPSEHEDGLLEYLEDIIGTSKFKQPLEEAFAEVDRLTEERAEKFNRLRITEKEKNALEDKKREAEDYLRLKNEHTKALSRFQQYNLWRCLDIEKEFEQKIVSGDGLILSWR